MILPTIGSKGVFKFKPPFDKFIKYTQVLEVASLRQISELEDSGESPYETIYKAVGLSGLDFERDSNNDVRITVFMTVGGEYIYVPSSYILSLPITNGIRYHEKKIIVNLGYIPASLNTEILKTIVEEDIYNITSIKAEGIVVTTSTDVDISIDKHNTFVALMETKKTIDKSYKTRYLEVLEINRRQEELIAILGKKLKG